MGKIIKTYKGQPATERRIVGKKMRTIVKLPVLLAKMKEMERKNENQI